MWLQGKDLGDVLRQAFEVHKVARVKRCIHHRGLWYVKAKYMAPGRRKRL